MWVVEYIIEDSDGLFFFLFFWIWDCLVRLNVVNSLSLSFWRRQDQGPYYYDSHITQTEMDRQAI